MIDLFTDASVARHGICGIACVTVVDGRDGHVERSRLVHGDTRLDSNVAELAAIVLAMNSPLIQPGASVVYTDSLTNVTMLMRPERYLQRPPHGRLFPAAVALCEALEIAVRYVPRGTRNAWYTLAHQHASMAARTLKGKRLLKMTPPRPGARETVLSIGGLVAASERRVTLPRGAPPLRPQPTPLSCDEASEVHQRYAPSYSR